MADTGMIDEVVDVVGPQYPAGKPALQVCINQRTEAAEMNVSTMRRWHSYIGLFIAPSVLFFALTGAAQLFSLHEEHGTYRPAAIIEKLSSVHKDQVFAFGNHHGKPAEKMNAGKPRVAPLSRSATDAEDADRSRLPTLLLKVFYLAVAIGLAVSACLGLWIGLTQTRRKRTARLVVVAGALIPFGLLLL